MPVGTVMKFARPLQWLSILVLGGFLPVASIALARESHAQAAGQTGGADQTQTTTTPAKKPSGVWHHFGEENKASRAQPRPRPAQASGWHYFGPAGGRSAPAPTTPNAAPRIPRAPPRKPNLAPHTHKAPPRTLRSQRPYRPITTSEMERRMFELINRDRLRSGGGRLRPLRWNEKLAGVARAHSLDMVRRGYFGHIAPDGKSILDRLNNAEIAWKGEGENIAIAQSVAEAETSFMNEPRFQKNHRWNILNPQYTDVGVGIVSGANGEYYITQDFIESTTGR